ncbi:MAG: hypothetical protein U5K69_01770 [Balneolaceae bacterium]|nr:hypothetical protein [Balneolaceae bacterium]
MSKITLDNGETLNRTISVDTWLNGATSAEIQVNRSAKVTKGRD